MRKQYHFRPSKKGFYAWDVYRLVQLSRDIIPTEISLSDIKEIDEPYWFGGPDDVATCRKIAAHAKLIEETDLSFPIILCSNRRIMDGMHRVLKALNLNHKTIRAVVFDTDPEPDYEDVYPDDLPT